MTITVKIKDMEDNYILELFYSHSLILWNRKQEYVKVQSIFPTYQLWCLLLLLSRTVERVLPQIQKFLSFVPEGRRV